MVEYVSGVDPASLVLPAYLVRSGDTLTVNANDNNQAKNYVLQVTHSTPANGNIEFKTLTLAIGWCIITGISTPTLPTTAQASYIIFSGTKTLTLTPAFLQVPACGYAVTETITWTIPTAAPITVTSDKYVLSMVSTNGLAHHAVNKVIMKNKVQYDAQIWEPSIEFDINITDPCRTSTITAITLTPMTVVLGNEAFQSFTEAVDSAGTSYGATVCGARLYKILEYSTQKETTVATVQNLGSGNYKIRAYSTSESDEGTKNLVLHVSFVNYPLTTSTTYPFAKTDFTLQISQATCDCKLITWDNPAKLSLSTGLMKSPPDTLTFLKATANEASKSASPAIRACYRNGGSCPLYSTITIVDDATGTLDAAFMTVVGNTLTVAPTKSSQIKTFNMRVTQTT